MRTHISHSVASSARHLNACRACGWLLLPKREIHVERSRGPRFVERVHAVNRPDRRSGPGEPTRLLAAPTESLPTATAAEGWAQVSGPPTRKLMTGAAG